VCGRLIMRVKAHNSNPSLNPVRKYVVGFDTAI